MSTENAPFYLENVLIQKHLLSMEEAIRKTDIAVSL
jgi:hypothetical protein